MPRAKTKRKTKRKTAKRKPRKTKPKSKPVQDGEGVYDWLANRITGSKLLKGEVHAPVYTKQGFQAGRYIGPGTHLVDRLKAGDEPVSKTDRVAQAHDIRYSLSNDFDGVRQADLKMIKKLEKIAKDKSDYRFNLWMAKAPIKTKMWLEDKGIVRRDRFASFGGVEDADKPLLRKKLKELEQDGYGKAKPKKKKSRWMIHVQSTKKKNPGMKYSEILKLASKSYQKKK